MAGSDASTGLPRIVFDTSMGTMTVELDEVQMPITTANFLAYVDAGFFDGTIIRNEPRQLVGVDVRNAVALVLPPR